MWKGVRAYSSCVHSILEKKDDVNRGVGILSEYRWNRDQSACMRRWQQDGRILSKDGPR